MCVRENILFILFMNTRDAAWVRSGFSGFLPHPKNMQSGVRLIGDSKVPVGVNVSVDGCLSLYVRPCNELTTCPG